MGLNEMFQESADLKEMLDPSMFVLFDEDPFYVSEVVHKAFIKVDEVGTEAAAYTRRFPIIHPILSPSFFSLFKIKTIVLNNLVGGLRGGGQPKSIKFHADHPFFFFIRSQRTKSIPIFCGSIYKPVAPK